MSMLNMPEGDVCECQGKTDRKTSYDVGCMTHAAALSDRLNWTVIVISVILGQKNNHE